MRLHYLGTAAAEGWPAIFCGCAACQAARELGGKNIRTRSQMLIDGELLCDLGPDTLAHALTYGLDLGAVSQLLVTHTHSDHFYPEDLLFRAEPYGHNNGRAPLTIYGNSKTGEMLTRARACYDDASSLDSYITFVPVTVFEPFMAGSFSGVPLPAVHDSTEDCLLYEITSRRSGRRMLYANDSAIPCRDVFDYLAGRHLDAVSLDCTMGGEPSCASHMSLADCITVKEQLLAQGSADDSTVFVITHFSHNGGLLHDELCAAALPYGLTTAFDGMTVELRGAL